MTRTISSSLLAVAALGLAVSASAAPPAVPATPARIDALVYAVPFTLRQGYPYDWRAERPFVTEGQLLVLRVKPALVYPRQTAEPVLYVGSQTAERLNVGYRSGHVVAIVPGASDLTRAEIWFGSPALPEQVNAASLRKERSRAAAAGIRPLTAAEISRARREPLKLQDKADLLREAGVLVERYAADEEDLARTLKREESN